MRFASPFESGRNALGNERRIRELSVAMRTAVEAADAHGSPLPQQGEGEGEGEGLSRASRAHRRTPHLNPLPFFEGRGENSRAYRDANSTSREVARLTSK